VGTSQAAPSFNEDIRPILSENCYACHGPDGSNRKAALRLDLRDAATGTLPSGRRAIVPGDKEASALIQRIATRNDEDRMPPAHTGKTLTADEIDTLARWIEAGADWAKHWAFEPVKKPEVPQSDIQDWSYNEVDSFVAARHAELGLTPSREADRRTLIRRLYFDLHGLPPTLAEIEAFETDTDGNAYEQLVDRLLESPRYGERWARHWLDVAHYGETHGYDKDKPRRNAWPYRDYVIQSLNADKPYGEFVAEQIAGDVFDPADPEGVVATGFLAAGPWDFVGHVELREGTKDKRITRVLDRDDMVGTVMNTFTSLTMQCARCHDHKFDPISQAEYYGLQAVFAGVERADRPYHPDADHHARRVTLTREQRALETKQADYDRAAEEATSPNIKQIDSQLAALRKEREALEPKDAKSPSNGYHSAIEATPDESKWVQIDLGESMPVDRIVIHAARPVDFPDTPGFGFPQRFVVEASMTEDFSNPTVIADHRDTLFENPGNEPVTLEADVEARYIRLSATELWERREDFVFALGEMQVWHGEKNVAFGKAVTAKDTIDAGLWNTRFLVDGFDSRKALNMAVNEADEKRLREVERSVRQLERDRRKAVEAVLGPDQVAARSETAKRLAAVKQELDALPDPHYVYAGATDFKPQGNFRPSDGPRKVSVLARGDVDQPIAPAVPGGLDCIEAVRDPFPAQPANDEGNRRAALTEWITHPDNPLTWRSIVNRVWQYHFGRGIVETPNDFGAMGAPPTHPELLDWLTAEFLENGQSLKWLHKKILLSATWRQAVTHGAANTAIDGNNRFYWRANRTPLDAESLRDAMLALSGTLDTTMGGPGFEPYAFVDDHSPRYLYQDHDQNDPASFRRSIYRFIVRSVPDPFMETLDCADPSQSVPVRNETLTALQALATLNNPFVVAQSQHFADRLADLSPSPAERVRIAYAMATGSEPSDDAVRELRAYARDHGLANACRVILNSNAFIYID
jgi:hypothetical protein